MNNKREVRFSILSIWLGILIPILAAVIPFLIQKLAPEQELQFSVVGPITVKRVETVEISVKNNGSKPARRVQVWLKNSPYAMVPDPIGARGTKKDPVDRLEVAAKIPVKTSLSGEFFVIDLGDLRAKEAAKISVLSNDGVLSIFGTKSHIIGIEVKSDENVGSYEGNSIFDEFLYPFGFWMFVALMVLLLIAALHQEYFMDSKAREKMILKEIEKLER